MRARNKFLLTAIVALATVSCVKKEGKSSSEAAVAPPVAADPGGVTLSQEEYNYLVSLMGQNGQSGMSIEAMLDVLATSITANPAIADKIRGPLTAKLDALK